MCCLLWCPTRSWTNITPTIARALSCITKSIELLPWLGMSFQNILLLGLYKAHRPIDANVSPNAQQFSKKQKNPTTHSLDDYLALESFTQKLTFLKSNSWRIYVYISPNGTINSIPLKTFWFRKLVLWQCRKIAFPNRVHVCNEVT